MKNIYLLIFLFFYHQIQAQRVSLDPTFNNDGIVIENLSDRNTVFLDTKVQPDGKVVCAGYVVLNGQHNTLIIRYNSNGTRDVSFGTGGIAVYEVTDRKINIDAMDLQPDGKIIVAGDLEENENTVGIRDCFVARYKTDGTFDSSFGTNGITIIHLVDGQDEMASVVVQADGKIVATANSYYPAGSAATLFRLHADGSRDMSFGYNGVTKILPPANNSACFNAVLQPDGKILLAGSVIDYGGTGYTNMMIARLKPGGEFDSSFGTNGIAILPAQGGFDFVRQVAVLPDKKIVGAGSISGSGGSLLGLVKVDELGQVDQSFGTNGFVTASVYDYENAFFDMAIQNDGKIIACGSTSNTALTSNDMIVMRFNSNGTRDTSFSVDGVIITNPAPAEQSQAACISLFNNRIYVGGFTFSLNLTTPYKAFINAYRNDAFPLAFQLVHFGGTKNKNNNLLNWQTTDESAISRFILQKSNDGLHYYDAATIAAKGYINGSTYQFTDVVAETETQFYRLKIVNKEGSYQFSKVLVLYGKKTAGNLTLFPNPAGNSITVSSANITGNTVISVMDMHGRICLTTTKNIIQNAAFAVDVSSLPTGTYMLNLTQKSNTAIQKFIKK